MTTTAQPQIQYNTPAAAAASSCGGGDDTPRPHSVTAREDTAATAMMMPIRGECDQEQEHQDQAQMDEKKRMMTWAEWREAARQAAAKTKKRRSLNASTLYTPATAPNFKKIMSLLEMRVASASGTIAAAVSIGATDFYTGYNSLVAANATNPEMITDREFKMLRHELSRLHIRLETGDVMDLDALRRLHTETDLAQKMAETQTMEAFAQANERAQTAAAAAAEASGKDLSAPLIVGPGQIHCDPAYMEARERSLNLKNWTDELAKEIRRCSFPARNSDMLPTPTQHAWISPSWRKRLTNILSPETLTRKFISLNVLIKKISDEMTKFVEAPDRRTDRLTIVSQMNDAYKAKAAVAAQQKKKQQ